MGDVINELQILAQSFNFQLYIDRDNVYCQFVKQKHKDKPDFMLSANTGMIGVPEITLGTDGLGCTVYSRLNPYLRPSSVFEVRSEYAVVNSGTNLFNVNQKNTTANGVYNVFGYRQRGDTHGPYWETQIDGLQPGTDSDFTTNGKMAWGTRVDQDFRVAVRKVAAYLNMDASWLMAIMYHESSLNPAARNPRSTATGLIQFTRATAIGLGTTTTALARMTAVEQMTWVQKYLNPYRGRLSNLPDWYMAIFLPSAIGKPLSYVIATKGDAIYNAQPSLDSNGDGTVTKEEAVAPVYSALRVGQVNAI